MLNIEHASLHELSCLVSKIGDSWVWHYRAAHMNMHHLNHLVKMDLVISIPKLKFGKISCVKHVKKGNKLKFLFKVKTLFLLQNPLNYFIWIYLVHLEP